MRRVPSTAAALMAAAALLLLLPESPAAPDKTTYEQETRRMFVAWKAKMKKAYETAGEEECRYALFKDSRCRVARSRDNGDTTSGLNGLADLAMEEFRMMLWAQPGEGSYEEETRRAFAGWKAEYGKVYRDAGDEECRYRVFKGNRRVVVELNAAATAAADGETAYRLNRFGDLTNEEVRGCGYDGRGGECQADVAAGDDGVVVYGYERLGLGKLRARCQAAVAGDDTAYDYEKRIRSQMVLLKLVV
ncbi:hypothetical protein U9M48_040921 [Paspalum notatum var. saurae]|uniref:Cathepsin propeptide inhibitor domain-containing protein n=1 Tax=Paspalum notatum var. saurae TaxID=547442 RepID=A0AAQ3URI7_PASNO